jgi:hypothetical protein
MRLRRDCWRCVDGDSDDPLAPHRGAAAGACDRVAVINY